MNRPVASATQSNPDPQQVATMLDALATADRDLSCELDRVLASRSRVSETTVAVLEALLATLRPAANVRAQLASVDPGVLSAALRLRRVRQNAQLAGGQR